MGCTALSAPASPLRRTVVEVATTSSLRPAPASRAPVVGMAATGDGRGYWLVASDGGVFSFGDARFRGSTGRRRLNRPVVGMAATGDGRGYWLVASDGGVFSFGDARFEGSAAATGVADAAITRSLGGYLLVSTAGAVRGYGAPTHGSLVATRLARAVVAVVADGRGGYWLADGDGQVAAFGGADAYGEVVVPPLAGMVVTIDPGHDGGNATDTAAIDQLVNAGGFLEACDTVGTTADDGYPEHAFNFDVALRLRAALLAAGATVTLTRTTDDGVGPCIDERTAIANAANAEAAVSIHADGALSGDRGFAVDVPLPVTSPISDNRAIVGPSALLGADVRNALAAGSGMPVSDYIGAGGIVPRADLGGLNLSTVPKVLVEMGNMRNADDAALEQSPAFRQVAAVALAAGITRFLEVQDLQPR